MIQNGSHFVLFNLFWCALFCLFWDFFYSIMFLFIKILNFFYIPNTQGRGLSHIGKCIFTKKCHIQYKNENIQCRILLYRVQGYLHLSSCIIKILKNQYLATSDTTISNYTQYIHKYMTLYVYYLLHQYYDIIFIIYNKMFSIILWIF